MDWTDFANAYRSEKRDFAPTLPSNLQLWGGPEPPTKESQYRENREKYLSLCTDILSNLPELERLRKLNEWLMPEELY